MNINGFIEHFLGGARNDLFEVWINYPTNTVFKTAMTTAYDNLLKKTSVPAGKKGIIPTITDILDTTSGAGSRYVAKGAQLPKSAVTGVEAKYKGRPIPFPGTRNDPTTMTVTFYNDTHFMHRNAFEIWSQQIRTTQTNQGRYPGDLMGTVKVFQHDQSGNVLKAYKLVNCWPEEIGEIELNWDNEEIEVFSVVFKFQYILTDTSDSF